MPLVGPWQGQLPLAGDPRDVNLTEDFFRHVTNSPYFNSYIRMYKHVCTEHFSEASLSLMPEDSLRR